MCLLAGSHTVFSFGGQTSSIVISKKERADMKQTMWGRNKLCAAGDGSGVWQDDSLFLMEDLDIDPIKDPGFCPGTIFGLS